MEKHTHNDEGRPVRKILRRGHYVHNEDFSWTKCSLVPCSAFIAVFCFLTGSLYHVSQEGWGLYGRDISNLYIPCITYTKQSILAGMLPLWNPYEGIGGPFFAEPYCGLLYPANWMIFFLDAAKALMAIQVLDIVIGMGGMLLYTRYLKLGWPAAILAAGLFGYSVTAEALSLYLASTYCWLPIIILSAHRLFDKPGFAACVTLTGSLTMCFFAGFFQYFYYINMVLCIYVFFLSCRCCLRHGLRAMLLRIGFVALAFFLTAGVVSIQLLPTIELSLLSVRSVGENIAHNTADVFDSLRFGVFGVDKYLCEKFLRSFYFGAALFLIPFSLGSKRHRMVTAALFSALLYVILFVASKRVAALTFFGKIPFADAFREQARMIALAYFMVAVLAGIGLDSFWENAPLRLVDPRTGKLNRLWAGVVIFTAGLLCPVFLPGFQLFSHEGVRFSIALVFVAGVFMLLRRSSDIRPRFQNAITVAMASIALCEVLSHEYVRTGAFSPVESISSFSDERVKWIKEHAGYERTFLGFPRSIVKNHKAGAMLRFHNINSYTAFTLKRWGNYVRDVLGPEKFRDLATLGFFYGVFEYKPEFLIQNAELFGLASLRFFPVYAGSNEDMILNNFKQAWKLTCENSDEGPAFRVYENKFALPRAYLVNGYIVSRNEEESLRIIMNKSFDSRHLVALENASPTFPPRSTSRETGQARIKKYEINEVEVETQADEPSIIVLTDSFYPGWEASVDGARKPIWRANSLFRAVEAPPGKHTIIFRYRPASVRWGAIISFATIAAIIGGLFRERRHLQRAA